MGIIRKTKSVELLLEVFEQSKQAISVVDLVSRLKQNMNKTTVYRILDRFEQDGIVHSFMGQGGLKWYARCQGCSSRQHTDLHPHFQCQHCGQVECLHLEYTIPQVSNRKVESTQLLLIGLCDKCNAN